MPLAESPPPLRPVLRLFRAPRPGAAVRERLMDCAQPWFEIDGARYRAAEPRARSKARQRLEREALETLAASGLQPLVAGDADLWAPRDSQGWFDWMLRQQDRLQMQGWQIELDADFGFRLHEPAPGWTARLEPGEDPDWFNLALDIEVDGQTQPLLPLLRAFLKREGGWTAQRLAALRDDEPLVLRDLADERWIKLPAGRLKPILATLGELYEARPRLQHGALRLPRAAAGAVLDLAGEAGLSLQGEAPLRAWAQPLADPASLPAVAPPTSLRASLRPYQQQGLNWLQFLRAQQLGGVLADDMGLGKTLQTLAHLLVEQAAGRLDRPALVIAPTSLMFNWRAEARRFAPSLRVQVLQGPGRRLYFDRLHQYDLLLSTYALLPRDAEALSAQTYSHLILDEAQAIKNPRAQAAQALARLRAR
ncbi:MAG TPA: SNF2-related protein, partial [Nevskiaceae bacterium]|nr:SNF2-related protein [Nevskiaceae bacterium]